MNQTRMSKNILKHKINRNIIFPNVALDPYPFNINEMTPKVEIIEFNSDGSEKQYNNNNSWSHVNSVLISSAINRKTREKNPLNYKQDYSYDWKSKGESSTDDDLNETFNSHCGACDRDKEAIYNQVKSLTIINNNINSDTSSEVNEYDDIEIIHFNDTVCDDNLWNSNTYTIMDCNDNFKKAPEWIYSLKHNKYSSENDYELSNTDSNDTTSCSTVTNEDEVTKIRSTIVSPIFNWIPKLNLISSPLPTVTELTEPNKHSSSDVTENSPNFRFKKSTNGWLDCNSRRNSLEQKINSSSKLSTLSQRERRRTKVANILNKQTENKEQKSVYSKPKVNSTSNVRNIDNNLSITNRSVTALDVNEDAVSDKVALKDELDATNVSFSSNALIKSNAQPTQRTKAISDTIDKLEGNWISNDNNDELIDVYDYDLDTVESGNKQNISNEENTSAFAANINPKPTNLSQNLTLSNNVPFLHLSFETDFDEDKKSCFKRFYNFINCCK